MPRFADADDPIFGLDPASSSTEKSFVWPEIGCKYILFGSIYYLYFVEGPVLLGIVLGRCDNFRIDTYLNFMRIN